MWTKTDQGWEVTLPGLNLELTVFWDNDTYNGSIRHDNSFICNVPGSQFDEVVKVRLLMETIVRIRQMEAELVNLSNIGKAELKKKRK